MVCCPVTAVPTTVCIVPLLGNGLNSVNVPIGLGGGWGGKKKKRKIQLYRCMQELVPSLA